MQTFGSSGGIQYIDGLCFLPQNTINEKIFVFLYFWFIAMFIFALINLIRTVVMMSFRFVRIQDIRRMANFTNTRRSDEFCYWSSDYGIWFTLSIFHRNLSPVLFQDLMDGLIKRGNVEPVSVSVLQEDTSDSKPSEENVEKDNFLELCQVYQ